MWMGNRHRMVIGKKHKRSQVQSSTFRVRDRDKI
jgi:hypothetical protein